MSLQELLDRPAGEEQRRYKRDVAALQQRDAERAEEARIREAGDEQALAEAINYNANRMQRERELIEQEPPGEVVEIPQA